MFVKAIDDAVKFTRPLLNGQLIYGQENVISTIHTLTVLNKEGDILTWGYVADFFKMAEDINDVFTPILFELKGKSAKEIKKLETKYDIKENDIALIHNILVDITDNPGRLQIIKHPVLDMAIIRFENKDNIFVKNYPVFRETNATIGEQVCKLGYCFPEYDTYYYDKEDCMIKTHNKVMHFPLFPLDGMVTRNIVDPGNEMSMFEMSTPVYPGQAGGPILDQDGLICGLQIGTKRISSIYGPDMPFNVDLGIGVHSSTIMKFLDTHNIKYSKKKAKNEKKKA